MTSRTTRQNLFTLNFVLRLPHHALLQLFHTPVFATPVHVEDPLLGPQKPFRFTMTFQTPFHLQCRGLERDRHFVDFAVTRRTADAFVHVNAVVEVSVVRQIVYADPLDRFSSAKTGAHRFEIWTVGPDLFMTTHARVG